MRKYLLLFVALLIIVPIGRLLYMVIPASGLFSDLSTVGVDQCRSISAPPGPEDVQIDHRTGLAYISATDRRDNPDSSAAGIYTLDLTNPEAVVQKLSADAPDGFAPHGIYLLEDEDRLFVVSHPNEGHAVEIFDIADDGLVHVETITSDLFTDPNDIVAVGSRKFYVSNFQNADGGLALTLEQYLGLPVTNVLYFDGQSISVAASGLIGANGVNVSADGSEIYVAEALAQAFNRYRRNGVTGQLSDRQRFSVGTGADNIDVSPDGVLHIGAHPNMLAFVDHAADPSAHSPSQVIRVDPAKQQTETIFMAANGETNGSSVGAVWQGHLLIGNVYEPRLTWCDLSGLPSGE